MLRQQIANEQFTKELTPQTNQFLNPQNPSNQLTLHHQNNKAMETARAAPRKAEAKKSESKELDLSDPQYRKIFVGGLPHNLALSEFKGYFSQYGTLEDCVILKDKRT